jgi:antitoxin component YwqK of YwqJK toxin-antitoxin module
MSPTGTDYRTFVKILYIHKYLHSNTIIMNSKHIALLVFSGSLLISACQQVKDFTNKAEAKNEIKNGKKEGKWMEYLDKDGFGTDDTAAPIYKLTVYKAGKPCGMIHGFYKSGKEYCEIPYVDSVTNGVEKNFYENGKLQFETTCTNGKVTGEKKWYYPSGALQMESYFTDDRENGVRKEYAENGKLQHETHYGDGKMNGVEKYYFDNGTEKLEITYTNDVRNGMAKDFYENGKVKSETLFADGMPGETKHYDENGNEVKK